MESCIYLFIYSGFCLCVRVSAFHTCAHLTAPPAVPSGEPRGAFLDPFHVSPALRSGQRCQQISDPSEKLLLPRIIVSLN